MKKNMFEDAMTRRECVRAVYRAMYRESRLHRTELLSNASERLILYSTLYYLFECNCNENTRVLTRSRISTHK